MKVIAWTCDRCAVPIHADRTTVEVVTGPERLRRPRLDFCSRCATGF